MAVDTIGAELGPIGLTVAPPETENTRLDRQADAGGEESSIPAQAPLPSYQGSKVDQSA
jgi:hypothetical protein